MDQRSAPLANLEEDIDNVSETIFGEGVPEIGRYLPDNLFWFRRDDVQEDKVFFLTDAKFNVVKRVHLNPENNTKDLNTVRNSSSSMVVVDAESENIDYRLLSRMRCLGCCRPFRKLTLSIQSSNEIDLFSLDELKKGLYFELSGLDLHKYYIRRKSVEERVFDILSDNGAVRIGSISKRYMPISRHIRTQDGHFHIKFNENAADTPDEIKYVITLSVLLLVCN